MPVMCHIRARCFRWSLGLLECGAGGIANGIRKRPLPRPLAFDATHRLGGSAADHLGVAVGGVITLPRKLSTTNP
jgi:hypothetical protein